MRDGSAYRDFLVLYRTNAQSRVFEEALPRRRHSLPRRRRRRFLRARRDQRHRRVPALHPRTPRTPWRSSVSSTYRAAGSGSRRCRARSIAPTPRARLGRRSDLRRRTAALGGAEEAKGARALCRTDRRPAPARRRYERRRPARRGHGRLRLRARAAGRRHPRRAAPAWRIFRSSWRRARVRSRRRSSSLAGFLANIALVSDLDSLDRRRIRTSPS